MARNVANMYKKVAEDIRNKTHNAPNSNDAAALYELLNSIEESAKSE